MVAVLPCVCSVFSCFVASQLAKPGLTALINLTVWERGLSFIVWAKVSLVGIELLSVEARVVIASVETYLQYAEASHL